jgi:hypothetical protein
MATWTRLSVALYVHCLPCFVRTFSNSMEEGSSSGIYITRLVKKFYTFDETHRFIIFFEKKTRYYLQINTLRCLVHGFGSSTAHFQPSMFDVPYCFFTKSGCPVYICNSFGFITLGQWWIHTTLHAWRSWQLRKESCNLIYVLLSSSSDVSVGAWGGGVRARPGPKPQGDSPLFSGAQI